MRRILVAPALLAALLAACLPARSQVAAPYRVGAAVRDISPIGWGTINTGGYGFGDGSSPVSQALGRGGRSSFQGNHIAARALVVEDAATGVAVAMVSVETQGMFAAYQNDPESGLDAIAQRIHAAVPALPPANVTISNDHTHAGPDAIGVWGFIPSDYLEHIASRTVDAVVAAYQARRGAVIVAGASDAPDLIYNQTCTEALNQSPDSNFPNTVCDPFLESKDSWVRVLQARDAGNGSVIATAMSYAAHATLGGGAGVHGDWPQFMSEALTQRYGGTGIAYQGTNGRTQPCRPRCSFTDKRKPGYEIADRVKSYTTMLMYHVEQAMTGAPEVQGPVAGAQTMIRHNVENPIVGSLLFKGDAVGAPIQRSQQSPWLTGTTVGTIVSALRIGDLLISGAPGEPYPNIAAGVAEATNVPPQRHWTLALADDQLGYLIAPVEAWPAVASQVAINDNVIFNVSPTIGDHVMCAQIRMARAVGFTFSRIAPDARCAAWDAYDAAEAAVS
ncbi:MAG TPA: hypothetical protein VM841_07530 [Actinomycetota bacterium]|nr:hypothetical protein [Actinomycetota bacterium]